MKQIIMYLSCQISTDLIIRCIVTGITFNVRLWVLTDLHVFSNSWYISLVLIFDQILCRLIFNIIIEFFHIIWKTLHTWDKKYSKTFPSFNVLHVLPLLQLYHELYGKSLPSTCMDFSTDATLIVTGSKDSSLRIYGTDFGDMRKWALFCVKRLGMCRFFVYASWSFLWKEMEYQFECYSICL